MKRQDLDEPSFSPGADMANFDMRTFSSDPKNMHASLRNRLMCTTACQMVAIALCIGALCAGLAVRQYNDAVDSALSQAIRAAEQEAYSMTGHLRLAFAEPIQGI